MACSRRPDPGLDCSSPDAGPIKKGKVERSWTKLAALKLKTCCRTHTKNWKTLLPCTPITFIYSCSPFHSWWEFTSRSDATPCVQNRRHRGAGALGEWDACIKPKLHRNLPLSILTNDLKPYGSLKPRSRSNDKSVELSRIYIWRNLLTSIIYCISGPKEPWSIVYKYVSSSAHKFTKTLVGSCLENV